MFEKPFKLAKMFVENSSIDLSKNKFENVTLVWDMNVLFEEFVYQVIRRKINGVSAKAQAQKRLLDDKNRITKADIIVKQNDTNEKIIIDTKYKKLLSFDSVASADLYQVGMYCVLHNDKKGNEQPNTRSVLLYPKYPNSDYTGEKWDNYSGTKYSVSIKAIDLMKKDIKDNLGSIVEDLDKIIKQPYN